MSKNIQNEHYWVWIDRYSALSVEPGSHRGPWEEQKKKDLFPTQLSGGQQQLIGIARALIAKPKLLLADEPTGNLNSKQGEEIMDLFSVLNNEGVTIIQVTHSEKNASYGSRIINLLDGRIEL